MASESVMFDARSAAVYEDEKVPAIFAPLAEEMMRAVSLPPGPFLDVACGTGIVARMVRERDPSRAISGLDISPAMLARARESQGGAAIDWCEGDAQDLPFADDAFATLVCQQGLQFVGDEARALSEMGRVLAPGGLGVITVWDGIPPMFTALASALERHVDDLTAKRAVAPFVWTGAGTMAARMTRCGLHLLRHKVITVDRVLTRPYENLCAEIMGSLYAGALTVRGEATLEMVAEDTLADLRRYMDGKVLAAPQPSHLFVFTAR